MNFFSRGTLYFPRDVSRTFLTKARLFFLVDSSRSFPAGCLLLLSFSPVQMCQAVGRFPPKGRPVPQPDREQLSRLFSFRTRSRFCPSLPTSGLFSLSSLFLPPSVAFLGWYPSRRCLFFLVSSLSLCIISFPHLFPRCILLNSSSRFLLWGDRGDPRLRHLPILKPDCLLQPPCFPATFFLSFPSFLPRDSFSSQGR